MTAARKPSILRAEADQTVAASSSSLSGETGGGEDAQSPAGETGDPSDPNSPNYDPWQDPNYNPDPWADQREEQGAA